MTSMHSLRIRVQSIRFSTLWDQIAVRLHKKDAYSRLGVRVMDLI
jgi:hypothetical protein